MKIAIIGTGIAGLGAGYIINQNHDVTFYEKNDYIGGHSRTVDITTPDGETSVDTGFIVFNKRNYPHLVSLFEQLDVPIVESDMSFGVSIMEGWLEYSTRSLKQTFAQKRNILRPKFLCMLADILKFHEKSLEYRDADITLREMLDKLKLGAWFRDYFLLPMGGAIWSMPVQQMLDYPARTFIRFFDNHGLLGVNDAPQWFTVVGGSRAYVDRLTAPFKDNIKLNCGVLKVIRHETHVEIIDFEHNSTSYDQVVFACHSDQALMLNSSPTPSERQILGSLRYQDNHVVLHSDTSFMPQRKDAWSSWVYLSKKRQDKTSSMCVSYWMNNLQPLGVSTPVIVTLNPPELPKSELIYDQTVLEHPVFDQAAIEA